MADDKKRQAISKARIEYLENREALLQSKVDKLGLALFDKINQNFLNQLELSDDGKVLSNGKNIRATSAINSIYKTFNQNYNIPVVKSFIGDMPGIGALNEKYFNEVVDRPTSVSRYRAETVVNNQLGITRKGELISGGFTEKFINSTEVLDAIKKKTLEGITQGKGFQELRKDLQETIQGVPKQNNGKLHQYYRNNAYDTYTKVDRLYSDTMAKDLQLTYFYYSGGIINTTRHFCRECNGHIFNTTDFKKLRYNNLTQINRPGIPDGKHSTWVPLIDLGGYGCRHTKDYISTKFALKRLSEIFDLNKLLITPIKLSFAA